MLPSIPKVYKRSLKGVSVLQLKKGPVMLKTAQIACTIDHKITALKITQNPLVVLRKPSSLIQTAIICSSVGIEKFPEKASQQFSQ